MEVAPKIPKINALTGLRGIAALWVVVYHIWSTLGEEDVTAYGINITPFFLGEFGVDIFFVLSGFAVFLPCAHAIHHHLKISWQAFFILRIARLFPAYHMQLLFIFLLFSTGIYNSNITFFETLKHIFLLQNFPPKDSAKIIGVYWTLPVEFNFYLSIPILFFLIKRMGIICTVPIILSLCIAYRYMIFELYGAGEPALWLPINQLFGRLDEFIIGIGAAIFFTKFYKTNFYKKIADHDWLYIIFGMVGIVSCLYYYELNCGKNYYYDGHAALFLFNTFLAASIGILIITLTAQGNFGTALFANRPIVFLGIISYGIYLWHCLILQLLLNSRKYFSFINELNALQAFFIGIYVTIIVASLSYYFIEKPCLNLA